MNVNELIGSLIPHIGSLHGDEGVRVGDPNAEVRGILVCFMAGVDALREARREGCNLVICHETPYLPYEGLFRIPEESPGWSTNAARTKEIEEGGLTILRLHGSLDRYTVYDTFRERLGLPAEAEGESFERIYPVEPAPLRQWVDRAKAATGLEHVRFFGDPERTVTRIGLPWGGLGLFVNVGFFERLIRGGVDLLICGESDDYAMRYMADAGVAFIETGHSASENPGLAKFAGILGEMYPGIKTVYHENPVPYTWG